MSGFDRKQFTDPRWCEAQYNNRLLVPTADTFIAPWPGLAAQTRARLPMTADISYGAHGRETIDVFHAEKPRGLMVFIHGGYWRVFSKHEFSWVADALVADGFSVALVNYPLCPEATIGTIVESCERAVARIWADANDAERASFVVAGHSAGGYLTAAMFVADWSRHGMPASPFSGGLSLSGLFQLQPLVNTSMNADIRLTAETAEAWSLDGTEPRVDAPLVFVVGGEESSEFIRQSVDQAATWGAAAGSAVVPAVVIERRNHFNVVEGFRERDSVLFGLATGLLTRDAGK